MLLDFAMGYRVGEASNPGPSEDSWCLSMGCANTSGLSRRADQILELNPGLWCFSETQLSEVGFKSFRAEIRQRSLHSGRDLRLLAGAPVPNRSLNSDAGGWSGVATVSDFPLRKLELPWKDFEYVSARVMATSCHIGHHKVDGVVVYGAAQSPTFQNPTKITKDLLDSITSSLVLGGQGPRYVAGDYNVGLFDLTPTQVWYELGWRDLQLQAYELWNVPMQATCKGVTHRDFFWASPELLRHLREVQVHQTLFCDHAVIEGKFEFPRKQEPHWYWPSPCYIDWTKMNVGAWHAVVETNYGSFPWQEDSTASFRQWSQRVEESLCPYFGSEGRLPAACKGRGQHLKPRQGKTCQSRCKPARPGEEGLQDPGLNTAVTRWYKQLRRLQALLHSCRNGATTAGSWSYQAQCWSSVIRASGFKPNFLQWWPHREVQLQGSPTTLGNGLPSLAELECIFTDFRLNFRRLEDFHLQAKRKVIKQRRHQCSKALFRAVRPDAPAALDVLGKKEKYEVTEVDAGGVNVRLDKPLPAGTAHLQIGTELFTGFRRLPDDWVEIDCDTVLVPGSHFHGHQPLTTMAEIQAELQELWGTRWNQLKKVPTSAWDRIFAFARDYMPTLKLGYRALDVGDLAAVFKKGAGLRTRGPDAWAREDIEKLPKVYQNDICSLFRRIESGGQWPDQLTLGQVSCLAKRHDAMEAVDFRPITLFSLWYRIWGCCRARDLLQQLSSHASFQAHGYVPGRSCEGITYTIQASVELALQSGNSYCGALIDIVRCFSCLPRQPIQFLARILGVPHPIIHGWMSFLRSMRRMFKVRQQVGATLTSDSGLPEGDAMSCLGMLLVCFSFHHYLQVFEVNITSWSFVDNLELTALDPGVLMKGFLTMETWADLLKLDIDAKKSAFWATKAEDRQVLATMGFPVIEAGKDLGVAMTYGATLRNRVLQDRIVAVKPFWLRLQKLDVGRWFKLWIVHTALLPRSLHGGTHIIFGQHWIQKLRTWTMRSLNVSRAGANPILRLAFVYPVLTDPGFFDCWSSMRMFYRQMHASANLRRCWASYVCSESTKKTYGPFAKIQSICMMLNWSLSADLMLYMDGDVEVHLLQLSNKALFALLEHHWKQAQSLLVSKRKDYEGLDGVDFHASFFTMKGLDPQQEELLHCIRDGTFFLNSFKAKFDVTKTSHCPKCGAEDTLSHRALDCTWYESVRVKFPDCIQMWHAVPVALSHHGVASGSEVVANFWKEQLLLPEEVEEWHSQPVGDSIQHIFTDGSSTEAAESLTMISAWACVHVESGLVLACDLLPGLCPTNNRAELWAVYQAVCWCRHHGCQAIIFTDSDYVVKKHRRLMQTLHVPWDWPDADIWEKLLLALQACGGELEVRKTKAHVDPASLSDASTCWEAHWNAAADTAAKVARLNGGSLAFRLAWQRLCRAHGWRKHWSLRFQSFLLALAERSLSTEREAPELAEWEDDFCVNVVPNCGELHDILPVDHFSPLKNDERIQAFGVEPAISLLQWLLILDGSAEHLMPVSFLELFVGFYLDTKVLLPLQIAQGKKKIWAKVSSLSAGESVSRTLGSLVGVFRHLFDLLCDVLSIELDKGTIARPTCGIQRCLPAVVIAWPVSLAQKVHSELAFYTRRRPIRNTADMARHWP